MAKLKAGKKGVYGDHEFVFAAPDDPFWVGKKGYVVVEEDEEMEVDLDSMTVDQLHQFVKDYDLDIPITTINPKAKKVKAIEEALAAAEEADADADADEADEVTDEDEVDDES